MLELADKHVSETCERKLVQVQILSSAQFTFIFIFEKTNSKCYNYRVIDHEQHLVQTERSILREDGIFPFGTPQTRYLEGTFVVEDPFLQPIEAFHQSSSAILIPRSDGNFVVPAIGFNEKDQCLDLSFMGRETMPATFGGARRVASWWGTIPTMQEPYNNNAYTPKRREKFLQITDHVRILYDTILKNQQLPKEMVNALRTHLSHFVAGSWLKYYSSELPLKLASLDPQAIQETEGVFADFRQRSEKANSCFSALSKEDKLLLTHSFNLIIQANITLPILYMDEEIPSVLSSTEKPPIDFRSPLEIVPRTQGVKIEDVKYIYLPDEVKNSPVEEAALQRLQAMGVKPQQIHRTSEILLFHQSCQLRYGHFSSDELREFVRSGQFVHVSKYLQPTLQPSDML